MSFEVRHLLLSLIDFTIGGFQGFPYDRTTPKAGPADKMKVADVLKQTGDLYIGIRYGLTGIIVKAWKDLSFLQQDVSVTEDANRGWQYLPLANFKKISRWAMEPNIYQLDGIDWKGKPFGTNNLYRVAKSVGEGIFIGIKGGLAKLKSMTPEEIKERQVWEIRTDKKNIHWFSGDEFCGVLESKGVHYD